MAAAIGRRSLKLLAIWLASTPETVRPRSRRISVRVESSVSGLTSAPMAFFPATHASKPRPSVSEPKQSRCRRRFSFSRSWLFRRSLAALPVPAAALPPFARILCLCAALRCRRSPPSLCSQLSSLASFCGCVSFSGPLAAGVIITHSYQPRAFSPSVSVLPAQPSFPSFTFLSLPFHASTPCPPAKRRLWQISRRHRRQHALVCPLLATAAALSIRGPPARRVAALPDYLFGSGGLLAAERGRWRGRLRPFLPSPLSPPPDPSQVTFSRQPCDTLRRSCKKRQRKRPLHFCPPPTLSLTLRILQPHSSRPPPANHPQPCLGFSFRSFPPLRAPYCGRPLFNTVRPWPSVVGRAFPRSETCRSPVSSH